MVAAVSPQVILERADSQPVLLTFDGPQIVSDTGLLAVRALDRRLGVLAGLAPLLPDPRARKYVTHSAEALLT